MLTLTRTPPCCPSSSFFGDTVNTASRMESTSYPQCVHLSAAAHALAVAQGAAPASMVPLPLSWVKGKGIMATYILRAGAWQEALGRSDADAAAAALLVEQASAAASRRQSEEFAWRGAVDASHATAAALASAMVAEAARVARALEAEHARSDAMEARADADDSAACAHAAEALASSERDGARCRSVALEAGWDTDAEERRAARGTSSSDDVLADAQCGMNEEAEEARWVAAASVQRAHAARAAHSLLAAQASAARAKADSQAHTHAMRAELRGAVADARATAASVLLAREELIAQQKRMGQETLWEHEVVLLRHDADADGQQLHAAQAASAAALAHSPPHSPARTVESAVVAVTC